jgi:hypothetical protein
MPRLLGAFYSGVPGCRARDGRRIAGAVRRGGRRTGTVLSGIEREERTMALEVWMCAALELHATEEEARACLGHEEQDAEDREPRTGTVLSGLCRMVHSAERGGTVALFTVRECFGCGEELRGEPGVYYCDGCVAEQIAGQIAEREAFEAFHDYADRVARGTR